MKKSLFTLAGLFIFIAVFTTSCDPNELTIDDIVDGLKDDSELIDDDDPEQLSGTYQFIINETVVAEGTTEEVGLVQDLDGSYFTTVTLSEGNDLSILVAGFSTKTGETTVIEGTDVVVTVLGYNILKSDDSEEFIIAEEGTITRVSKEKISFEGKCKEMLGTEIMSFNGYVESKAFQKIQ